VRYTKHKLALFFAVQALGVAAMVGLVGASQHLTCHRIGACRPPAASLIVAIALIVGEIAVVAAALKNDVPVWRSLLGLGVVYLIAAFMGGLCMFGVCTDHDPHVVGFWLAAWHVAIGLILLGAGAAAAFWDLLGKLRRSDDMLPEDRASSVMWPLD